MQICYVDEAGCTGVLPSATSLIQPVLVIAGIVVDQSDLRALTADFLNLKRRFFPGAAPTSGHFLDWVLVEVKGAELRRDARSASHRHRRHALGFLDNLVGLLERHKVQIFGRLWVKGIGALFDGDAVYTSSIQAICRCFQHLLSGQYDQGFVVLDGRNQPKNALVSHSIFTQKYRTAGDEYPRILDMPTFGQSENHVGIQVADLLCSALLFPMATYAYCTGYVTSIHVQPGYGKLKSLFGPRLRDLQYRYQDVNAKWRGGITVSDALAHRSGSHLF